MRANLIVPAAAIIAAGLVASACSSSKSGGGGYGAGGGSSSSTSATASSVKISLSNDHLVGADGKTLYYNTVDTATNIQCVGNCASIWPPVLGTPQPGAGLDAGDFKTVSRPDGGKQVTFYGHPLYEFASDSPGTSKGDGIADGGGKWLVAPKDYPATGGASSSESSSSSGGY